MTAGAPTLPTARGPADLLGMVAADLSGCRMERRSGLTAVVTPPDGPPFGIEVRIDRRRFMTLQTTAVHVTGGPAVGGGALVLRHTGALRRTGMEVKSAAGEAARNLGERLVADGRLVSASLPLDFTSFVVAPFEGRWRATLELMGGSHVRMLLPPTRSYVRLSADQRGALLATTAALHDALPAGEDR